MKDIFGKTIKNEKERLLLVLAACFVLGFVFHGFAFMNLFISHDSINEFFTFTAYNWHIELGRILLPVYETLFASNIILPWMLGILGLLWFALAVYFITEMFDIRHYYLITAVAAMLVLNNTMTALIATYMQCFGPHMFAFMCAAFSASCWQQFCQSRSYKYLLLGALSCFLAVGLYQAYVAVTVTLIILLSLFDLLNGKSAEKAFADGVAAVAMILTGCAVYFVALKIVLRFTGLTLVDNAYNSLSNMTNGTESFLERIRRIYILIYRLFFISPVSLNSVWWMVGLNVILIVIPLICLVTGAVRKLKIKELTLYLVLLVVMPFGANIIRFLTPVTHDLMRMSYWLLYLLPVLLLNGQEKAKTVKTPLRSGLALVTIFLLLNNMQVANYAYVRKDLQSRSTLAAMSNIAYDLEKMDGYDPGVSKVMFIGSLDSALEDLLEGEKIQGITGNELATPITYDATYVTYFNEVLGRRLKLSDEEWIRKEKLISTLPCYPREGYITIYSDTYVVKLSWN